MKSKSSKWLKRPGLTFWVSISGYVAFVHSVFVLFWLPGLLNRSFRANFIERLGLRIPDLDKCIWIHGSSAGESLAVRSYIELLKKKYPDTPVVISTFTSSGYRASQKIGADYVIALPYDLLIPVIRTVKKLNPLCFVIIEGDYWPLLMSVLYSRKVPTFLINGRMTQKSFNSYKRLRWLYGPLIANIRKATAINETVESNLLALGMSNERILVTRNIKYDNLRRAPNKILIDLMYEAFGISERSELFIAASIHSGEAQSILQTYRLLRDALPGTKMLIAPRYVEDCGDVKAAAEMFGFKIIRRSAISSGGTGYDIVILDTIGELADIYSAGGVTFVGGSFIQRGGQNLLEPAYSSNAVLYGPHTENFAIETKLLEGKGGITVSDGEMLAKALIELFSNDELRIKMGENASKAVQGLLGGSEKADEFFGNLFD